MRRKNILLSVLMSVFMSVPMSFVMTVINVGFTSILLKAFLMSVAIGTVVAIPVAYFAMPIASQLADYLLMKTKQSG